MKASIWKTQPTQDLFISTPLTGIHSHLGIEFDRAGDDFIEATLPVDHRTRQPFGVLHGGASVVLAETLGSMASYFVVGDPQKKCVGIEVNASHLKSVKEGKVRGRVTPIRLGKTLHVWDILIWEDEDPQQSPVCKCRLTVMIL